MKPYSILLLLVLLCAGISINNAIYQEPFSFTTRSDAIEIGSFGFLKNGYFQVNVRINDQSNSNNTILTPSLFVCVEDDYTNQFDDYCGLLPQCEYMVPLIGNNATLVQSFKANINSTGYYYFLLTQCSGDSIVYTVSYALYNPGGNHLSYQYIPLPILLMVFMGIWILLTVLWCLNWIKHKTQNIKLHKVITLYPFSKLAMVVYSLGYWRYLQTYGAVGIGVIIFYWIFYIIFKVISCVVLLFIATGWGICKGRYAHLRKALYVIIILLAATLALGAFLGGFFTILSFIVYIPVLCIIFIKSDANVRLIKAQLLEAQNSQQLRTTQSPPYTAPYTAPPKSIDAEINNNNSVTLEKTNDPLPPPIFKEKDVENVHDDRPNTNSSPSQERENDKSLIVANLYDKLHMFIAFKWIMLVYLSCVIVIQFLSAAFPYGWVFDFFLLLVESVMFICIGLTFRLRKDKLYYEFVDEEN